MQLFRTDFIITVRKQININDPWAESWSGPGSAQFCLHRQQKTQQIVRIPVRTSQLQDLIAEPWLLFQVLGLGKIRVRSFAYVYSGLLSQATARTGQVLFFVADIGAQADIGNYSLAMRDTASSSLSEGTVKEIRKYPSPGAPKPLPGVSTTPVSCRTLVTNSAELP